MVLKKIAQSLMHCYFATVCSRVVQFSPKAPRFTGNTKNILDVII